MPLLYQIVIFLAAAVLAVPLFRRLGLGVVLGYLMAGVVIGPWGLDIAGNVHAIMHFGEIGVVFLLFVIGLELQPARLRAMRRAIFGPGIAQVLISGVALGALAAAAGFDHKAALVIGFALSLSSTAFVLHLLAERNELKTQYGRRSFGILLFQDLAAVLMIAALPLLATRPLAATQPSALLLYAGWIALVLGTFIVGGHYLLRPVLRLVAAAQSREIFTTAALLLVMGSALLMHAIGISMSLGAFMAGVLVADSEYRHQLRTDIDPFRGLLLGLFFIAVGMSINVGLIVAQPLLVVALAVGLTAAKALILYAIAYIKGVHGREARRLALYLAQGGEFAFVVLGQALDLGILPETTVELLTVVVALSMAFTPALTALQERFDRPSAPARPFDAIEETEHTVVIAGFGRFGQVIGRLLASRGIPFTALEVSPAQVDFVRRFGNKIYYGDASRLDLLRTAQVDQAKMFVLAVDDIEASIKIARTMRQHFPNVPLYARARNRQHVHQLMDAGVREIIRETFLSSLHLGGQVLKALGLSASEAANAMTIFREHDERTLARQRALRGDNEALIQSVKEAARELKALFEADAQSRQQEHVTT
ncbi:MAG: monovalent cation:proton antiporter-2 (CPA2) family protein, partial [Nitrococcus sp.]|nr:monovalent cation:proton antiporter-2 (CPA2) family protein [Nitrococcus sp.]